MKRHGFIMAVVACLAACISTLPASPRFHWPAPTTQPGTPTETFSCKDVPLEMRGASGELAGWLRAFEPKPEQFDYTLQRLDEDDAIIVYRLAYPSAFKTPWPENNTVPAEFYLPKSVSGKMPAAIVLDIMDGSAIIARGMARGLAENGIAALYVPMAYYGPRRPRGDPHLRVLAADPTRTLDAMRQTVMDIRRAKAILASRPNIDPAHIGITGVSLGGIMTSLAAGVDGTFDRIVPILAGGDLAALVFHTRETRAIRQKLQAAGITRAQLEKMLAPVEPLNFAARIDPARCLMINAATDEVIPRWTTDALNKAIGTPRILWSPAGHYSSILYLPTIRQTAERFLKGQKVEKLGF